jgi:energy-converting hydrogenase Eha subunit H
MLLPADVMRFLLVLSALGMSLLAIFYMRRRELKLEAYIGWGLLAVLVPFLGPFLVILYRPGRPARSTRPSTSLRHSARERLKPNLLK